MGVTNKFIGRIFYSGQGQGFSEAYFLKGSTKTTALANVSALVTARKAMLSSTIEIVYSMVSDIGVDRDSYAGQVDVLTGDNTTTTGKPNRLTDAILLRQETANGKHAPRYVHGVPDSEVVDGVYTGSGLSSTWDGLLTAYIAKLISETQFANKVDPADPTTWTFADWAAVYKRGLTGHKVGKPFDQQRGRRISV